MYEQTVNWRFRRFLLSIYKERELFALDFSGILWYHKRVKLGCFATVPHGFDSVKKRSPKQGFPAPEKGDGNGEFLF